LNRRVGCRILRENDRYPRITILDPAGKNLLEFLLRSQHLHLPGTKMRRLAAVFPLQGDLGVSADAVALTVTLMPRSGTTKDENIDLVIK